MPAEVANNSIRLFMEKVAPQFRRGTVARRVAGSARSGLRKASIPR
jgi:hypothetical protein